MLGVGGYNEKKGSCWGSDFFFSFFSSLYDPRILLPTCPTCATRLLPGAFMSTCLEQVLQLNTYDTPPHPHPALLLYLRDRYSI